MINRAIVETLQLTSICISGRLGNSFFYWEDGLKTDLINWTKIETQIDAAKDLKTISDMQEQMEALKVIARQRDDSLKTVNKCSVYKFELEQKAGAIYAAMESESEGNNPAGSNQYERKALPDETPASTKQQAEKESGKARKTLNIWAKEAEIPEETILAYEAKCNEQEKEFTSKGVVRAWRDSQPKDKIVYPTETYTVIYADPPWKYTEQGLTGVSDTDDYGNVRKKYKQLSIQELCDIPVKNWIAKNAVLWLWVTAPFALKCTPIIAAWGFEYKAQFVWDKIKHNFGYYNSVRHEHLYICTQGACTPQVKKLFDSVQTIERTTHSSKPEEFRNIIDTLYPEGMRLEMFARGDVPKHWSAWGNEAT